MCIDIVLERHIFSFLVYVEPSKASQLHVMGPFIASSHYLSYIEFGWQQMTIDRRHTVVMKQQK